MQLMFMFIAATIMVEVSMVIIMFLYINNKSTLSNNISLLLLW